jgi:hypothetical protein
MTEGALPARTIGPPAAAAALLVAISVARFAFPDVSGIMMLSVVPITLLGMMLGWGAGLLAATAASAVFFVWAATEGHIGTLDYADQPLAFFVLGGVSGFYAHGALGDYDLARAAARARLRRAIAANEIVLHYQRSSARAIGRCSRSRRWRAGPTRRGG